MSLTIGIAGLGAMGSMTALELVRRGHRVIGFDRFHPPHQLGSSHGKTRIIREAYFEHPQYVPLVQRAYQLWNQLEAESGVTLYRATGGVMIGPPDGVLVAGARRSALTHRLQYEELPGDEVRRRYPMFEVPRGEVGLYEPRAGVLFPELAIQTALRGASRDGAELHFDEPVERWSVGSSITVATSKREVHVDRLILSTGAWTGTTAAALDLPLVITRQPLYWFEVAPDARADAASLPIFIWEWEPGRFFYGFPDLGDGVKVAIHHEGESIDPERPRRPATPDEAEELRGSLAVRMPGLGAVRETAVCLYTNTPSQDFLIDRHPADPRLIIASPCSGHGFKFAPAIGEVLSDLAEERPSGFDLTPFRLKSHLPKP
jgi:sarcosine oxidase